MTSIATLIVMLTFSGIEPFVLSRPSIVCTQTAHQFKFDKPALVKITALQRNLSKQFAAGAIPAEEGNAQIFEAIDAYLTKQQQDLFRSCVFQSYLCIAQPHVALQIADVKITKEQAEELHSKARVLEGNIRSSQLDAAYSIGEGVVASVADIKDIERIAGKRYNFRFRFLKDPDHQHKEAAEVDTAPLTILSSPYVHTELGLSPEQIRKIATEIKKIRLADHIQDNFWQTGDDPLALGVLVSSLMNAGILNQEQKSRFDQIHFQRLLMGNDITFALEFLQRTHPEVLKDTNENIAEFKKRNMWVTNDLQTARYLRILKAMPELLAPYMSNREFDHWMRANYTPDVNTKLDKSPLHAEIFTELLKRDAKEKGNPGRDR